jgi:hypothetical protein
VCPSCGASLTMVVTTAPGTGAGATTGGATGQAAPAASASTPAAPAPQAPARPVESAQPAAPLAPAGKCSGCGAPLPAGARFCTICGTMAG